MFRAVEDKTYAGPTLYTSALSTPGPGSSASWRSWTAAAPHKRSALTEEGSGVIGLKAAVQLETAPGGVQGGGQSAQVGPHRGGALCRPTRRAAVSLHTERTARGRWRTGTVSLCPTNSAHGPSAELTGISHRRHRASLHLLSVYFGTYSPILELADYL